MFAVFFVQWIHIQVLNLPNHILRTHKAYVLNELKKAKRALALKDEAMQKLEDRLAIKDDVMLKFEERLAKLELK